MTFNYNCLGLLFYSALTAILIHEYLRLFVVYEARGMFDDNLGGRLKFLVYMDVVS